MWIHESYIRLCCTFSLNRGLNVKRFLCIIRSTNHLMQYLSYNLQNANTHHNWVSYSKKCATTTSLCLIHFLEGPATPKSPMWYNSLHVHSRARYHILNLTAYAAIQNNKSPRTHTQHKTANNAILFHFTPQLFVSTTTIFSTVLYIGKNSHNDFF